MKNWKKVEDSPVTPYGKTAVESYTMYGNRTPKSVEIISFSHDLSDILHTLHIKKAKSEGMNIKLIKNEFRLYDETVIPITPNDNIIINMTYQR